MPWVFLVQCQGHNLKQTCPGKINNFIAGISERCTKEKIIDSSLGIW